MRKEGNHESTSQSYKRNIHEEDEISSKYFNGELLQIEKSIQLPARFLSLMKSF